VKGDSLAMNEPEIKARLNDNTANAAAEAVLTQLTRLLVQDFAPSVRLNAIAPGPIMTAALDRALPADMHEGMIRNRPLTRLGEVEDIAAAALYLASPASGWVTGKVIEVDGGAESSVWLD
jgi:7-alpha-hydroxysteroid dehydrogenase